MYVASPIRRAAASAPATPAVADPEDPNAPLPTEESLLSTIGNGALSGLSMVGNLLDLPGSMIRDTLTGNNPLDQLLSPFSHENRMNGRDMLTQWGVTDANKETGMSGWLDDPMEGVRDVGGFAAEMALDPLSWLTGIGALGRSATAANSAAKGAQKAGGIAGALDKAGDALNLIDPGFHIGKGIQRAGGDKLLKASAEALKATAKSAVTKPVNAARGRWSAVDNALNGMATARDVAKRLTKAAFHAPSGGKRYALTQKAAEQAYEHAQEFSRIIEADILPLANDLMKTANGMEDPAAFHLDLGSQIRTAAEKNDYTALPEALQAPAKRLAKANKQFQIEAKSVGLLREDLFDVAGIDHFPREMNAYFKKIEEAQSLARKSSGDARGVFNAGNKASQTARQEQFKGFASTEDINLFTSDPEVHRIFDEAEKAGTLDSPETMQAAIAKLQENHPNAIVDNNMPRIDDGKFVFTSESGKEVKLAPGALSKAERTAGVNGAPDTYTIDGKTYTQVLDANDRMTHVAKYMKAHPQLEALGGIFTNHPLVDAVRRFHRDAHTITAIKTMTGAMSEAWGTDLLQNLSRSSRTRPDGVQMKSIFDDPSFAKVDRNVVYENMENANPKLKKELEDRYSDMGDPNVDYDEFRTEFLDGHTLDKGIADELTEAFQFKSKNWTMEEISKAFRTGTSLFKAGVLTHPARYTRDFVSGMVANAIAGMFSFTAGKSAYNAIFNRPDEFLRRLPQVQEYMKSRGWDDTADNASNAVREMYAIQKGGDFNIQRDLDDINLAEGALNDVESLTAGMPGNTTGGLDLMKESAATLIGKRDGSFNVADITGIQRRDGTVRTKTDFNPVRAGDIIGKHTDDANRMVGFIENMRRGDSATDSFKKVNRVQLDYNPATFTNFEQNLKKIFPFYSFARKEAGFFANELMTNPAGRLGKVIRAQRTGQTTEEHKPEWIANSGGMRIHRSEDGTDHYLNQIGLMHEDAGNLLAPSSPKDFALEILNKTNPILKAPIEYALGRSAFHRRPLDELDPSIGRILTNLGLVPENPNKVASPVFGSHGVEHVIANSPISRVVNTVKGLGDSRKNILARGLNVLTGLKINSVNPEQSRRGLRDLTDRIAKELGGRAFETMIISPATLEAAKQNDPERYQTLLAIKQLRKIWDQERRAKIKAEKEAAAAEE